MYVQRLTLQWFLLRSALCASSVFTSSASRFMDFDVKQVKYNKLYLQTFLDCPNVSFKSQNEFKKHVKFQKQ
jgi:hypothetical protein